MTKRSGFRGYVGSRAYFGDRAPQQVQNLVIRDYAARNGLHYLLSSVEYTIPGCFMMLENVLHELPKIEGIICYSIFMLPTVEQQRQHVYKQVIGGGRVLHGALEGLAVTGWRDIGRVEDIWRVQKTLDACPQTLEPFQG